MILFLVTPNISLLPQSQATSSHSLPFTPFMHLPGISYMAMPSMMNAQPTVINGGEEKEKSNGQ